MYYLFGGKYPILEVMYDLDFVENTFPCFSSNLFFLSWWILVSIYAIPMLSILYMLLSVHLYGFNKCGYLGNTCIDYNTVLCLSWSWLTVILIHYDECLVSVGALYFVLFIMLCFLPSFLWWVTSKSLWIHSLQIPVLLNCFVGQCTYCLWIPSVIHLHIKFG